MTRFQDHEHWLYLAWLVVSGVSVFGLVVCWNEGLIDLLYASDRTGIFDLYARR